MTSADRCSKSIKRAVSVKHKGCIPKREVRTRHRQVIAMKFPFWIIEVKSYANCLIIHRLIPDYHTPNIFTHVPLLYTKKWGVSDDRQLPLTPLTI